MARRSRGTLFRKSKVRIGRTGKPRRVKVGFYRCRYRDNRGELCDHTLRLPNGRGTTDRDVAGFILDDILKRLEEGKAVGLVDRRLEDATTPMRTVLARYLRHLRRKRTG